MLTVEHNINSTSPNFEEWLSGWEKWLYECVTTGLHHIGSSTVDSILYWQKDAYTLGFTEYAESAGKLLNSQENTVKIKAFQSCLLGYQSIKQLMIKYELDTNH